MREKLLIEVNIVQKLAVSFVVVQVAEVMAEKGLAPTTQRECRLKLTSEREDRSRAMKR
jgi:hypothetical protein